MSTPVREAWLGAHSYLEPLARWTARVEDAVARIEFPAAVIPDWNRYARWTARVEDAVARIEFPAAVIPDWNRYAEEFRAGVPLLCSRAAGIDLEAAGRAVVALVEILSVSPPDGGPAADLAALAAELRRDPRAASRIAEGMLDGDGFTTASPGLLRFLTWVATSRYLRPVVAAFARWRDEERWQRPYCPVCGSPPGMAQLSDAESARVRWLCCGRCRSRWQYTRTQCPFCEADTQKLSIVAVEGEGGLRIDWCQSCRGYLKTYAGQGNESVMLEDWTSLHLDLAARERGLVRMATSLFELPGSA